MIAATCSPPPASTANTPGPVLFSAIRTLPLDWPNVVERTVSVTLPVPNSVGNCASISVGEVLMRGSETSFAVTHTPPRICGSGLPLAVAVSARLLPRIVMSEPGANWAFRLAVFITPADVNEGPRPADDPNDTMLKPESQRRYTLFEPSTITPCGKICVWPVTPSSSATERGGH